MRAHVREQEQKGGVFRQSLIWKERQNPGSFLTKTFSPPHQGYQVARATNCFPPLPELVGTISTTIPLSINKHHKLSQDTQPRCLGGDQTLVDGVELLPTVPAGSHSSGGALWAGVNVFVPGTECNGSNWEKEATELRYMAVKLGWLQA